MDSEPAEHHISGVYTKMLMGLLRASLSPSDLKVLFRRAGETRPPEVLEDPGSWSSYHQFRRLLEERTTMDATSLHDRSASLTDWLRTWEMAEAAKTLDSPGELLADGSEGNPLVPIRLYGKTEVASDEWVLRERFVDGFEPFPEFCDFAAAQYALIPTVFSLPLGEITEEACQCRGDEACVFRMRWQEGRTEDQRAESLASHAEQLEARLAQIQDMITDLVWNERYEEVLQGFVSSSLRSAMGSTSAVLALEPRTSTCRQVFAEGLEPQQATEIADDLLGGDAERHGVVAVEVASARRRYGYLAVDQGGGVFSTLTKSTLETYARLTAAALDTADALDEAHHQANTAQTLLDLASSLTEIVSTQEMAAKVARAVPDVIDCDSAAIFLNTVGEFGALSDGYRLAGSTGLTDDEVAFVSAQTFPTHQHDESVNGGIKFSTASQLGNVASVSAPIVVAGEEIGFIVACVHQHPDRLTVTSRLADRLRGLAAQAATAIANARLVDQIRFQAVHDALTGLPNRALILDRAEQLLVRAQRTGTQVAALFIDLDGFKDVNDTLGHGVGDRLHQAVSERLSVTMRQSDTIGRLGGDEFIVLVEGAALEAGAELVAERLIDVLRSPFELSGVPGGPLTLSASIGIATGLRDSASELLRDADIALYEAKGAGKNRYVAFRPEMHAAVQDHHLLESELREALPLGQFALVYQPVFNLADGETTGVEALLRWHHPRRGVVQPNDIIPVLEETGLIADVGRWVLAEACRQGTAWHRRGYDLDMSVNVSARQLDNDQLVEDVDTALTESGFPPAALTIEITETAIMKNVARVVPRLQALKDLGVKIAIDDFGTGYSSLAYLQQFPVDTLKIDRSFIASMANSAGSGALIRTLVQLGKTLGLETLAEGIEEPTQYSQLERERCDSGQGYLYARPLDVEAVEEFLQNRMHRTAGPKAQLG